MKKVFGFLVFIAILIYGVILMRNIFAPVQVNLDMTPEEAYQKMEESQSIIFSGNLDRITPEFAIWADEENVGKLVEVGLFDSKTIIQSGDTDLFYIKFYYPDIGDGITATAYAIYSADDQIIGYAEETVIDYPDTSRDYAFLFYDKDKQVKPYYLSERDGCKIYNDKGEVLAQADYVVHPYDFVSHKGQLTITSYGGGVDLEHKMIMYARSSMGMSSYYEP